MCVPGRGRCAFPVDRRDQAGQFVAEDAAGSDYLKIISGPDRWTPKPSRHWSLPRTPAAWSSSLT